MSTFRVSGQPVQGIRQSLKRLVGYARSGLFHVPCVVLEALVGNTCDVADYLHGDVLPASLGYDVLVPINFIWKRVIHRANPFQRVPMTNA